jgi:hypothetical protein
MPRRKKSNAPGGANAAVVSADPIRSANRARRALKRAGAENIRQAFKLFDVDDRFASVHIAIGFASSIAAQPFTHKQLSEFETIGRAQLASLGVVEVSEKDGDRTEVIVSVPLAKQDGLVALYAQGLKRTAISTSRGFVEVRGAAVIETLRPMVAALGGVITTIERPVVALADETAAVDVPEATGPREIGHRDDVTAVGFDQTKVEPCMAATAAVAETEEGTSKGTLSDADAVRPTALSPEAVHLDTTDVERLDLPPVKRRSPANDAAESPVVSPGLGPTGNREVTPSRRPAPARLVLPVFRRPHPDAAARRSEP